MPVSPERRRSPLARPIGRRPRAGREAPEKREQRVRHVMGLIAGGRWIDDGSSVRALAAEWGMSVNTVYDTAAEAQRRVFAVDDGDFVRRRISAAIDEVLDHARAMVRGGDPRALAGFAQLARVWAEITGARPKGSTGDEVPVFRVVLATSSPDETGATPAPAAEGAEGSEPCQTTPRNA